MFLIAMRDLFADGVVWFYAKPGAGESMFRSRSRRTYTLLEYDAAQYPTVEDAQGGILILTSMDPSLMGRLYVAKMSAYALTA